MIEIDFAGSDHRHDSSFHIDCPKGAGSYAFVMFKTKTKITIDGKDKVYAPHTAILYGPDDPQYYRSVEDFMQKDFVHFTIHNEDESELLGGIKLNTPFKVEQNHCISKLIWLITYEYGNNYGGKEDNKDALMRVLIKKLRQEFENEVFKEEYSNVSAIAEVRHMVTTNPQNNWTIKELADRADMSESYFQIMYKKIYGTNCIADVIEARLQMARALVRSTTSSIQEISEWCGYNNIEHFSRQFKRQFGITPLKYRNSSRR